MLNYRHVFHAGSFIDVHKHITLRMLLRSLLKKDSAFCYIDTHAGAGSYDLQSEYAQKNREYENGIYRVAAAENPPEEVIDYLDAVNAVNPKKVRERGEYRYYPGSPLIARQLLRKQDRMLLTELHNTEAPLLRKMFDKDKQVSVLHGDAFVSLKANLPPKERRGLILIDPPYEVKAEFQSLAMSLIKAWQKWPTGIFAVWYPLQKSQPVPQFHYELRAAGVRKVFIHEFYVLPDSQPNRMAGSGMLIINPPWQFDKRITAVLNWLVPVLDQGGGSGPHCEWIVPE